jgi:hypothetical protein
LSEELIQRLESLLKEQGYELVGVYEREQLDLSKVEKCVALQSLGSCSCSVNLDVVLHEVNASDVAIVIFAEGYAFPEPLEESDWCSGDVQLEIYVEADNIKPTVSTFSTKPCIYYV